MAAFIGLLFIFRILSTAVRILYQKYATPCTDLAWSSRYGGFSVLKYEDNYRI